MEPTIKELEDNKHRLELIKMARELLNEEYINKRAQDHNRWLAESDVMWRTKKLKLPYPPFASYPTDEEIVAKATVLYNFVNSKSPKDAVPSTPSPIITPEGIAASLQIVPVPDFAIKESSSDKQMLSDNDDKTTLTELKEKEDAANILEPASQSPAPATLDTPVFSENSSDQFHINQSMSGIQSLLPGWVRRSQGT